MNYVDVIAVPEPGPNRLLLPVFSYVVAACGVKKGASIYSGILRLTDLAFSMPENETVLYPVVPDACEKEVQAQLSRPAIRAAGVTIHCILFSELRQHCKALVWQLPGGYSQDCTQRRVKGAIPVVMLLLKSR